MSTKANSTAATMTSRRVRTRWAPIAEVAGVTASVLVLIWIVQPRGGAAIDVAIRTLVVSWMIASNVWHRDSLRRLGLRFDNSGRAAKIVLPPTALVAAIVAVLGFSLGRPSFSPPRLVMDFVYYLFWGFAQQYALQGFVLLRLLDAGFDRPAPIMAALVFSLVHAPNPGLMIMTFAGAWMWCVWFRREPNLWTVTVSHACLAAVAASLLPIIVTGGSRIGPRYFR